MGRNKFHLFLIGLKGMAMGAADVVPGVSGGTIAFISGIYEELIESIDKLNLSSLKLIKSKGFKVFWKSINGNFLLSLFSGIAISILSLAKIIKWLLQNEPVLLWSFFFGLVVASIVFIGKQIKTTNFLTISAIIISTLLSYYVTRAEPFASPDSNLYLLFCGFVAIIAMILPGISGAFILLLLGAYEIAIETINNLIESVTTLNSALFLDAITKFAMLGIGAIVGIKVFSKILNWMFKHHKNLTLAILTGFMIGSLNKIWPWKKVLTWRLNSEGLKVPLLEESIAPSAYSGEPQIILALTFMLIGFLTIFILEKLGSKRA
jgi:putative membrane protein